MTQRFNNELWEIDPATRKVKTKIAIGREPVAMAPFAGDSCLLIANNLPEMPSTAYSDKKLDEYDKFYCMSTSHKFFLMTQCAVPADKIEVINVADPYMCGVEVYRQCRDEICSAVKEILKQYEN